MSDTDPFDSVLDLEDTLYNEGYRLGVADGAHAGQIQGRAFGVEKGFEKYLAMARLHGRAAILEARLPKRTEDKDAGHDQSPLHELPSHPQLPKTLLTPLPSNSRLEKHVHGLLTLTEPYTLSTQNNEDAVSDFDDRLKRAQAKMKVIERIVGEGSMVLEGPTENRGSNEAQGGTTSNGSSKDEGNIEDISPASIRR